MVYKNRGDATIIALSTYVNALVYRSIIIAVGMPYEYSLSTMDSVNLGEKKA